MADISVMLEPSIGLDAVAHAVIGAAIEVHRHLGPGFLEAVYERALLVELQLRKVSVRQQVPLAISYKGIELVEARLDLLIDDRLVVELKAIDSLSAIHTAQLLSYLKAGGFQLGLLINFNVPVLRQGLRRVIWNPSLE